MFLNIPTKDKHMCIFYYEEVYRQSNNITYFTQGRQQVENNKSNESIFFLRN